MIKNLSQLKKAIFPSVRLEIVEHCRPEYVGDIRWVTLANTQGFYSVMDGQPDHKISKANGGHGSYLSWGKAPCWQFQDGVCSVYDSGQEHTPAHLIMAFRVLTAA